jgi:hypothetical protein
MPEICRFYGIVISMFYRDHNPPHIHAEYGSHKVTIELISGLVKGSMPRRALNLIFEWISLHEVELMEQWQIAQKGGILTKIEPLP